MSEKVLGRPRFEHMQYMVKDWLNSGWLSSIQGADWIPNTAGKRDATGHDYHHGLVLTFPSTLRGRWCVLGTEGGSS